MTNPATDILNALEADDEEQRQVELRRISGQKSVGFILALFLNIGLGLAVGHATANRYWCWAAFLAAESLGVSFFVAATILQGELARLRHFVERLEG